MRLVFRQNQAAKRFQAVLSIPGESDGVAAEDDKNMKDEESTKTVESFVIVKFAVVPK